VFDHGWVRFIVASLLLGAYGGTEMLSRLTAWKHRPARVRRPIWSHLLGFASLIAFYGFIGSDGRSIRDGLGNQIGVLLCVLAMALRFMTRRSGGPDRHPDLAARLLFFAALPLVVGSPKSWIGLTLPQAVIAAKEAQQRNQAPRPSSSA
jgi:hypothetical protein